MHGVETCFVVELRGGCVVVGRGLQRNACLASIVVGETLNQIFIVHVVEAEEFIGRLKPAVDAGRLGSDERVVTGGGVVGVISESIFVAEQTPTTAAAAECLQNSSGAVINAPNNGGLAGRCGEGANGGGDDRGLHGGARGRRGFQLGDEGGGSSDGQILAVRGGLGAGVSCHRAGIVPNLRCSFLDPDPLAGDALDIGGALLSSGALQLSLRHFCKWLATCILLMNSTHELLMEIHSPFRARLSLNPRHALSHRRRHPSRLAQALLPTPLPLSSVAHLVVLILFHPHHSLTPFAPAPDDAIVDHSIVDHS
nr:hypothetical protein Iba_chr01cCG6960 [Ipomoea batatas]